ncbi:MAG: hypothetical protein ACRC1K_03705, partial [Planctomycetia bacterium]
MPDVSPQAAHRIVTCANHGPSAEVRRLGFPATPPPAPVGSEDVGPNLSLDVPFHVPAVHRLRFTRDVLGDDRDVLLDLLETSGDQPAKVQFWVDESLAAARPDLEDRLQALAAARPGRLVRAGGVQQAPGGEAVKNDVHLLERMLRVFETADLDRRSYVVVVGGGAVLDAVGFAAAIAHRGLRLVRLPTTTLA